MSNDPDDLATVEAAATLRKLLKDKNIEMTKDFARWVAFSTICKWLSSRTAHWAVRRGKAGFGTPDAMMVGFAEAALSQIADKCADLPMDLPIGKWAKNDVARMFAVAHEAIQATMEQTLESPDDMEAIPA